ncbi:hypothetical protein Tco_1297030, partial [Tanacetum coccineum]
FAERLQSFNPGPPFLPCSGGGGDGLSIGDVGVQGKMVKEEEPVTKFWDLWYKICVISTYYSSAARPAGGLGAEYSFVATMDREIRRDPDREVGYGITDSWDEIVETLQGTPVSTDTELGRHMIAFETRVRQDTDEIYTRLDDEQSQRQLLAGRLNMLFRDRRAHARTARLMEAEARLSREAWGRSMDASNLARAEVMSLHHRRQKQLTEALKLIKRLQTQMAEFERQQGPAKGPAHPELLEEAGSSS